MTKHIEVGGTTFVGGDLTSQEKALVLGQVDSIFERASPDLKVAIEASKQSILDAVAVVKHLHA